MSSRQFRNNGAYGLNLQTLPRDILVIDHVEKPAEN